MPFLASSSAEEPMSLASLITGSNCLKACGMEDIQHAARRASDLFATVRVCAIVLTSLLALYFVLLIALRVYNLNVRQKRSNGEEHFVRESNEKLKEFCPSSTSSLSSCSRPTPIYSHPQLSQSAAEFPHSHDTTAAATPMPMPPPSICRQYDKNADDGDDGSAEKPNLLFTQFQLGNSQKLHFNSLSDYLLAKRMAANAGNGN
uniref:Uncharacterized protein n=1 Tax=Globodera rostochiensis TaxID=31243 RepID=A0A914H218_GLORO